MLCDMGKDNAAHFCSDAFILFHQNDDADFCRGQRSQKFWKYVIL